MVRVKSIFAVPGRSRNLVTMRFLDVTNDVTRKSYNDVTRKSYKNVTGRF